LKRRRKDGSGGRRGFGSGTRLGIRTRLGWSDSEYDLAGLGLYDIDRMLTVGFAALAAGSKSQEKELK